MIQLNLPGKTVDDFLAAVKEAAWRLCRYDDRDVHFWVVPTVVKNNSGTVAFVRLDVHENTFWTVETQDRRDVVVTRAEGRTWLRAMAGDGELRIEGGHEGPSRLSVLHSVVRALAEMWCGPGYDLLLGRAQIDALAEEAGEPVPQLEPSALDQHGEDDRPGRPPRSDLDWAWGELCKGRGEDEVYNEWRSRPDVVPQWGQLADPKKAFRAAMRRRARATKTT